MVKGLLGGSDLEWGQEEQAALGKANGRGRESQSGNNTGSDRETGGLSARELEQQGCGITSSLYSMEGGDRQKTMCPYTVLNPPTTKTQILFLSFC